MLTMLSKIYRCWMVYGHSRRVVYLPIIFWFGSLTCIALYIYYDILFVTATDGSSRSGRAFVEEANTVIGFYCCNIATNLFSTCMDNSVLFFEIVI